MLGPCRLSMRERLDVRLNLARLTAMRVSTKLVIAYILTWLPYNVLETWKVGPFSQYSKQQFLFIERAGQKKEARAGVCSSVSWD